MGVTEITNQADQVRYLLSFLAILVERQGGEIVLEDLDLAAGVDLALGYELDTEANRVTLRTKRRIAPPVRRRPNGRPIKPRPRREG